VVQDPISATRTAAASPKRCAVISAGFALAGFAILVPMGYPAMAAFVVFGMVLGLSNLLMVRNAAARFALTGAKNKKTFAGAVLKRLFLISALALGTAFWIQPDGLGTVAGLAIFQLITIFVSTVPLLRELRAQEGALS
jgi:hypothetical protein